MNTNELIFKKGSTTYYYSSLFFPRVIREQVGTLYAFVRTADNFVDTIPQDTKGFKTFVSQTWNAWKGKSVSTQIVDEFVQLAKQKGIHKEWVEAFLGAMEQDLHKKTYNTQTELDTYMYGSAEVIGLMMARVFNLPQEAYPTARLQGKAMQLLNFIRDVEEDKQLGRTYLPVLDRKGVGKSGSRMNQSEWSRLLNLEIKKYRNLQERAYKGYVYLPFRYRVPVMTAAQLYFWTSEQIRRQPSIVWQKKVKPSKYRVFFTLVKSIILSLPYEI